MTVQARFTLSGSESVTAATVRGGGSTVQVARTFRQWSGRVTATPPGQRDSESGTGGPEPESS